MSRRRFEEAVMPHLDAAFNYARWLTGSQADAEDVVQEACVRAMRFLPSLRDGDARPWLLAIVRNAWHRQVGREKPGLMTPLDGSTDDRHDEAPDPEERLVRDGDVARVRAAVGALPAEFREVIVLREIEGLAYKEIADVVGVPIGTVMSRLSRARERLLVALGTEVVR